MSIKLSSLVWELNLPSSKKFVLLAFADHSNDDGVCFPSVRRVAWKCGISERSVQRMIAEFKARGLIKPLGKTTGGRNHTVTYVICPEKGDTLSPFRPVDNSVENRERVTFGTQRVTPVAVKGDTAMSPEASLTVSMNRQNPPAPPAGAPRPPTASKQTHKTRIEQRHRREVGEAAVRQELNAGGRRPEMSHQEIVTALCSIAKKKSL
jgi:Helix-turn-helix domain